MRLIVLVITVALAATACESQREKCAAARTAATSALQPIADQAVDAQREAYQAREAAMHEAAVAAIDLGNVRSDAVVSQFSSHSDAPVGVEVAVGALIAAMLAVEELATTDAATADRVTAAVNEELAGRFAELMTLDPTGHDAEEQLTQAGDQSSTRLQLLVRELPERVRARVLDTFATMQTQEGDPPEGTSLERLRDRWAAFQTARSAAADAQSRSRALAAALDGVSDDAAGARAAAEALPTDLGEPRAAALAAVEACSGL